MKHPPCAHQWEYTGIQQEIHLPDTLTVVHYELCPLCLDLRVRADEPIRYPHAESDLALSDLNLSELASATRQLGAILVLATITHAGDGR